MTDKEKMMIAKSDMYKLESISKQLIKCYETRESTILGLYGSGIDYSKERVQTTPVNMMEEAFARASEIDDAIDRLIDQKRMILKEIYKLSSDKECNILIDKYSKLKSYSRIAKEYNKPISTIKSIHNNALIHYFTKCCINS